MVTVDTMPSVSVASEAVRPELSSRNASHDSRRSPQRPSLSSAVSPRTTSSDNDNHWSVTDNDGHRPPRKSTSNTNRPRSDKTDATSKKWKKLGSVLGTLAMKEPSTSALDEFAQKQKKQTGTRGGRVVPVGMPGISSQKLPEHVPKVNSKWDGLPASVKERSKTKDTLDSRRDSKLSTDHRRLSQAQGSSGTLSNRSTGSSTDVGLKKGSAARHPTSPASLRNEWLDAPRLTSQEHSDIKSMRTGFSASSEAINLKNEPVLTLSPLPSPIPSLASPSLASPFMGTPSIASPPATADPSESESMYDAAAHTEPVHPLIEEPDETLALSADYKLVLVPPKRSGSISRTGSTRDRDGHRRNFSKPFAEQQDSEDEKRAEAKPRSPVSRFALDPVPDDQSETESDASPSQPRLPVSRFSKNIVNTDSITSQLSGDRENLQAEVDKPLPDTPVPTPNPGDATEAEKGLATDLTVNLENNETVTREDEHAIPEMEPFQATLSGPFDWSATVF